MDAEEIRKDLLEQISKLPEEQSSQLREKIESMSDDEIIQIAKSQPQNCLFCEIVSGRIETFRIYESNNLVAILDINPVARGHMLIMPRNHFQFISQIPNDIIYEIFSFVKAISPILLKVTNAQGITIHTSQGIEQNVPHFAVNLIPRYKDDNLNFLSNRQKASKEELEKIRVSIRNELSGYISSQTNLQKEKKQDEPEKEQKQSTEKVESGKRMRIP